MKKSEKPRAQMSLGKLLLVTIVPFVVLFGLLTITPPRIIPLPIHPANPMMTTAEGVITLTTENVVNFRGVVNKESVGQVIQDLLEKREDTDGTIYLFINSPGGGINAGLNFIRIAKWIPNVKTVTIFAASMAHAIVQQMPGDRLILPTGITMAHKAAGGFRGSFEVGEVETQLKLWKKIVLDLEMKNASRLGISISQYKEKITNEWWSYGEDAVYEGVMDEVKEFRCNNELIKKTRTVSSGMFSNDTYSECPLLVYPVIDKGDE